LQASQSQAFTATVTGTSNSAVTWTMTPQTGTLTANGLTATYVAPATITTTQTVTVTARSVADSTKAGTATVTLNPPSTFTSILVNSGGPSYVDSLQQTWSADTGFSGGSTASTTTAITNTSDPTLYKTERYGTFTYTFTVPNSSRNVTLKFAEIYWTKVNQRKFNVAINGTTVLSNFDIVSAAGAAFKAVDMTFPVTVTNGKVTIQFIQGSADLPKISAIQIR
jgi:hypothetical protein